MITPEIRQRVVDAITPGLVSGLGVAEPGRMCVEAAVCWALGEKHGDTPSCVDPVDRRWSIALNDAGWPSNMGRFVNVERPTSGVRSVSRHWQPARYRKTPSSSACQPTAS
jgi:hypothetical protein